MKSCLITGATGNIGSFLLPLLLSHPSKPKLVCTTRDAAKLSAKYGSSDRLVAATGSFSDPKYIEQICQEHSIDSVFVNLVGGDELANTYVFISALQRSPSVEHFVYLSVARDFTKPETRALTLSCGHAFACKVTIEDVLRENYPSGKDGHPTWTVLGPTSFFNNDEMEQQGMTGKPESGFLTQITGPVGTSRVSSEDMAEAVVKSFDDAGTKWGGKKIMLGTRKAYTTEETVKVWSNILGKPVYPMGMDKETMDGTETRLRGFLGNEYARSLTMMMETRNKYGFQITDEEYKDQVEFLGHEARSWEEHLKALVAKWKETA
ncbi:MAG: hypothetical protein M1820_005321 [Bogoriella megaspora]|nr:MAG: hypothetical protein M1820_005321 [Bogoriella megaspora]